MIYSQTDTFVDTLHKFNYNANNSELFEPEKVILITTKSELVKICEYSILKNLISAFFICLCHLAFLGWQYQS